MLFIQDKVAFVSVLSDDVGGITEGLLTHSGFPGVNGNPAAVKINIQPASPEETALSEGQVFKVYHGYVTTSGVTEGMRLTVSGTADTYIVRGRERYDYGVEQHFELTLEKPGVS